ncbi:MAG: two-component system LytT family response regulator [Paraglaciecola sp.]|jgi:two-component system LytT family response regulator
MNPLRVLVVDDEPLARESLSWHLSSRPNLKIIGCCNNAKNALLVIEHSQPDVIFLDIEMPGMSGLELAQQLRAQDNVTKLIFVTAFREFALDAFECQAEDYLLKPFTDERLDQCINNVLQACKNVQAMGEYQKLDELLHRKTGSSIANFIHSLEVSTQSQLSELQQVISLKCGSQWVRVRLDSILWIEAAGDYMCVHTEDGSHIIRKTLKQLERELDNKHFLRVSRSAMLNINKLTRLTPNSNGEYLAHLCSGEQVKVGRKYRFHLYDICSDSP